MPSEPDMYLEIITKKGGKIKGEAIDAVCGGQIDVDRFEVEIKSPSDYDQGSTGRVTLERAKFDLTTSIASTPLFQTLCTNDVIKSATLSVRKGGGTGKDAIYLQLRFNNARLVSYKISAEDEWADDTIELAYSGIEILYRQQTADGSLAAPMTASYDSATNTMVKPTLT
jgi:type VI secretion system Hcp family effector